MTTHPEEAPGEHQEQHGDQRHPQSRSQLSGSTNGARFDALLGDDEESQVEGEGEEGDESSERGEAGREARSREVTDVSEDPEDSGHECEGSG